MSDDRTWEVGNLKADLVIETRRREAAEGKLAACEQHVKILNGMRDEYAQFREDIARQMKELIAALKECREAAAVGMRIAHRNDLHGEYIHELRAAGVTAGFGQRADRLIRQRS